MTTLLASVVEHLLDYDPFGSKWFTAHHVLLIVVAGVMIVGFRWIARQVQTQPKRTGIVALVEVGLLFVRDEIVYPWLGEEDGRKFVPFFWTLFFFILLSNVLGMLPFPFNIWHRTATGNLAVTGALAIIAFFVIQVAGMRKHGWGGYWVHLVPHGVSWWLWPLVWVIEFIGLFTKPFALTVRLFANMTAGHAILGVLFTFMWGVTTYDNAFKGGAATVASFGFMLFIMLFETLVALIQAYIFTVLTAIFVSLAVAEEH
jgi:F-type H+-transporting ATPase subunit a